MKTTSILIGLAGIMATTLVAAEVQNYATAAMSDQSPQAVVDEQGNLRVPEDYRTAYQFLGAWAIAADQGKGSQQLLAISSGVTAGGGHGLTPSIRLRPRRQTTK